MSKGIILLVVFTINALIANYCMNNYAKRKIAKTSPIEASKPNRHATREGFPGKPHRLYIVYGGSGFIGSWFARYLLLRKEKVVIIDKVHPPGDLLRQKVHFYQSAMDSPQLMQEITRNIIDAHWKLSSELVIYNCCCERKYTQVRHHSLHDPGLRAIEVLLMALYPPLFEHITLINIGDTLCEVKPVHWMRWWDRRRWLQKSPLDAGPRTDFASTPKKEVGTIYGWYQGAIEALLLKCPIVSAAIRSEGIVTGHLGDDQLSTAILDNYAYLHSWGVPINFLHVEDLVRAGLALEYRLLDPETRAEYDKKVFSISGPESTTLEYVYDYIQQRRKSFTVFRIYPIVVWVVAWITSTLRMLFSEENSKDMANIFNGPPSSLTLARLLTVQACHRRNKQNVQRTREMLKYYPNYYTMGPILDEMLHEIDRYEESRAELEKKRGKSSGKRD